jgi:hypothetical protein
MSKYYVDKVTQNNVLYVREQIAKKLNYDMPYYARQQDVRRPVTDMDEFPYQRFYRGRYDINEPVVFDRDAGWRPRFDGCYKPQFVMEPTSTPAHCFETACSTVYPCNSEFLKRYGDRAVLELLVNRGCVDKSP